MSRRELAGAETGTPPGGRHPGKTAPGYGTRGDVVADIAQVSRQHRSLTAEARERFLAALSQGYSVTHAAAEAGAHRQRLYELRAEDRGFAAEWESAFEAGSDLLEDELRRRALGYDETTYDGSGAVLRRVRKFDTPSLVAALKARRPALYRESANVQVGVAVGAGAAGVRVVDDRSASLADVARVLAEAGAFEALDPELRRALVASAGGETIEQEPVEVGELEAGS